MGEDAKEPTIRTTESTIRTTESTVRTTESTAAGAAGDEAAERRAGRPETPPTPFDHPLFLPVLLFAGMIWFGYDGWINQDPDMLEHQDFNRYGFGVLTLLTLWFGYKGIKEFREDRAAAASNAGSANDDGPPPPIGPGSRP